MEKQHKMWLGGVIVVIVLLVGGSYGWEQYQEKKAQRSIADPLATVTVPEGLDEATRAVYEEKIQLTKEMFASKPTIWETWIAIGNLKSLLKDYEGALQAYQYSITLQANNIVGERNIANLYADQFKDYERAAIHYRAAIRNEVNNVELYTYLIMIEWKQLHDVATAESTLQTGLVKTGYHYDMVKLAADFYNQTGNVTRAKEYETALAKMARPTQPAPAVLGIPTN